MKHPTHYTSADDIALCNHLLRAVETHPDIADLLMEAEARLQGLSGFLIGISQAIKKMKGTQP